MGLLQWGVLVMEKLFNLIDRLRLPAMIFIAAVFIGLYFFMEWIDKIIENIGI